MIILFLMAGSILFALARNGKFMSLGKLRFRVPGLIFLGSAIQLIIFQKFWVENNETRPLTPAAYLISLSLLLVALVINHRVAGVKLLLLGFSLNFLAIVSNNGYMPVSPAARAIAGQSAIAAGQTLANVVGMGPDTRLEFLGDVFPIPRGFPFPNAFSIGDLLISIGAAYLIYRAMTVSPILAQTAQARADQDGARAHTQVVRATQLDPNNAMAGAERTAISFDPDDSMAAWGYALALAPHDGQMRCVLA